MRRLRLVPGWTASAGRLLLALVLVVLLACGDGGDSASPQRSEPPTTADVTVDAGPFDVADGVLTGPGADLPGGLTVVEGSALVGPVFPAARTTGDAAAQLLVTGDPVRVFNGYVDAARRQGMGPVGPIGCVAPGGTLACSASLVDGDDGESSTLELRRGPLAEGGAWSHLGLRYRPPGSVDDGGADATGLAPTAPLPPVELPAAVPRPASDDISAAVDPDRPPVPLPVGTELAAAPGPCGCATEGWAGVLVTDRPGPEVLAALAETVGAGDAEIVETTRGGRAVAQAVAGLVDVGFVDLRTLEQEDRTWVLISVATSDG